MGWHWHTFPSSSLIAFVHHIILLMVKNKEHGNGEAIRIGLPRSRLCGWMAIYNINDNNNKQTKKEKANPFETIQIVYSGEHRGNE